MGRWGIKKRRIRVYKEKKPDVFYDQEVEQRMKI